MARLIMYAIACSNPDCDEYELLVDGEHQIGASVTCDQGHEAVIAPAVPRAVGILVERVDKQLGKTFSSNRAYQDHLKYGRPIERNGEVVGHQEIVEMSAAEKRDHRDGVIKSLERTARRQGLTLEQAHEVRSERVREKRAKEIEAGQKPTVAPPKPMMYGAS